jgi:hypothetical protein
MTLPDFVLLSRANLEEKFTGVDSEENCLNPQWFKQYPHEVAYRYNSRGFRDAEWPDNLHNVIWCVGDSFSVGLGSPLHHTWPNILQRKTQTRCVNVSLSGASNQWLARKIESLSQSLMPRCVIVHWSFIHRRESSESIPTKILDIAFKEFYNKIKDPAWPNCTTANDFNQLPELIKKEILEIHSGPVERALCVAHEYLNDEHRRLHFDLDSNEQDDIEDIINCVLRVHELEINVIHSFIPGFASESAATQIVNRLDQLGCCYIAPFGKLDLARDGKHYDILTAEFFTDKLIKLI